MYPPSSAASKTLMEKASEIRITTNASSQPVCGIYYSSAFTDATAGTSSLTLSSWNHIFCTYDGATIKTYLNGILIGTTANTNTISSTSSIFYMGQNSSGAQRVSGQIDEIRLYPYSLTQKQVQMVRNEGSVRYGPSSGAP